MWNPFFRQLSWVHWVVWTAGLYKTCQKTEQTNNVCLWKYSSNLLSCDSKSQSECTYHPQICPIFLVFFSLPFPFLVLTCPNKTSWWFQPIWKICSSNWIMSPSRGENKKCLKPPPRKHPDRSPYHRHLNQARHFDLGRGNPFRQLLALFRLSLGLHESIGKR